VSPGAPVAVVGLRVYDSSWNPVGPCFPEGRTRQVAAGTLGGSLCQDLLVQEVHTSEAGRKQAGAPSSVGRTGGMGSCRKDKNIVNSISVPSSLEAGMSPLQEGKLRLEEVY
jgi:hypothetical protein